MSALDKGEIHEEQKKTAVVVVAIFSAVVVAVYNLEPAVFGVVVCVHLAVCGINRPALVVEWRGVVGPDDRMM